MLTDLEKTFILSLKGRVSKILNVASMLKKAEKDNLEQIYHAIDTLILYSGAEAEKAKEAFKQTLMGTTEVLCKTNKRYVKEHILPLINKLSTNKWNKGNE